MRYFIVNILLVLAWNYSFSQNILREQVEKTYLSQVGVIEHGYNSGDSVNMYLASVNLKPGNAWCAAFVSWVYQKNEVLNPKSGWSPNWFTSQYVIWKSNGLKNQIPKHGDVFGIYFKEKKRIAHVGFIHRFGESITITVEGNTNEAGSREGDGVYIKRRPTRQIYAVSRYIKD